MKKLRAGVLALTITVTPVFLLAQRGPEPQQGTGQNNPDMEHGNSGSKSDHPNSSGDKSGTAAPQSPGQESPDTQQTKPSTKRSKHKKHGGSHDQASPQS